MPRTRIAARLEIVEEQIALAQADIQAQRGVIEGMRQKGYTSSGAETNLTILEATLAMHSAERERLRAELAALPSA